FRNYYNKLINDEIQNKEQLSFINIISKIAEQNLLLTEYDFTTVDKSVLELTTNSKNKSDNEKVEEIKINSEESTEWSESNSIEDENLEKNSIQAITSELSADELYEKSMSASGATGAWNLAQELKELYPTDTRISEAVNKAANRLLVMGTSLHSNGRFADANGYYELLLS